MSFYPFILVGCQWWSLWTLVPEWLTLLVYWTSSVLVLLDGLLEYRLFCSSFFPVLAATFLLPVLLTSHLAHLCDLNPEPSLLQSWVTTPSSENLCPSCGPANGTGKYPQLATGCYIWLWMGSKSACLYVVAAFLYWLTTTAIHTSTWDHALQVVLSCHKMTLVTASLPWDRCHQVAKLFRVRLSLGQFNYD